MSKVLEHLWKLRCWRDDVVVTLQTGDVRVVAFPISINETEQLDLGLTRHLGRRLEGDSAEHALGYGTMEEAL